MDLLSVIRRWHGRDHLLIGYDGWKKGKNSLDFSRVCEYTTAEVRQQFLHPDLSLDASEVRRFPAVATSEIANDEVSIVQIGSIVNVHKTGKNVVFDFQPNPGFPTITNFDLRKHAMELGITDFEFHRTHWSIKDVDLFEVLIRIQASNQVKPKLFQLTEVSAFEPNQISVMMPFNAAFDNVYESIKKAASGLGMKCYRADDIWEDDTIIQDVFSLINNSRIVVCDCTSKNPNVFYEIGIAHTLGRDVILIAQSDNDIPADLRHLKYAKYLNNSEGLNELAQRLSTRIATILEK